ncbi:MAG: tetratricopeptide repeat protein, partial [Thermodesulfobacteriota bacterium]
KGVSHHNIDDLNEAIKAFDRAIRLKPGYAEAWYHRARVYANKGVAKKALTDLEQAVLLDASFKEEAKKDKVFLEVKEDKEFSKLID